MTAPWLSSWLAKEPAIAWTAFSNAITAGTLWGILPRFGIHVDASLQPLIVGAVNLVNMIIVRASVTPNGAVPPTIGK